MERGYKPDSIRALTSRFEAAKNWGVFSETGTPLSEISREQQLSIIDTSFLDEGVSALVIGILARRILAARKISTRRLAAQRFKEDNVSDFLEMEIPATWLFIDEAHTLIPSGNVKTPASNSLVEYVKQGRQPGCSIVFATQQPSAIDTRVLSQIDIILTHKLVFDDDVKAVYKRTPTIIPRAFKQGGFIKTLPVGISVVGDRREETTRAFVMKTRPRMSQHEGREAVTTEASHELDDTQVKKLATEMAYAQLEKEVSIEEEKVVNVVERLNNKYKTDIDSSDVINNLEEKGAVVNPKTMVISLPGKKLEEEVIDEFTQETESIVEDEAKELLNEKTVLIAFPTRVNEQQAGKLFDKVRKKKFLGLFGSEESIEKITLKFLPIHKVEFNYFNTKNTFNQGLAYINSYNGEFIQFDKSQERFIESRGLRELGNLSEWQVKVLLSIGNEKIEEEALVKKSRESKTRVERAIDKLLEKDYIGEETVAETLFYFVKKKFDLPPNPLHDLLDSLNKLSVSEVEAMELQREIVEKREVIECLRKLWKKLVVTNIKSVYLPFYEGVIKKTDGSTKRIWFEALTGKELDFFSN